MQLLPDKKNSRFFAVLLLLIVVITGYYGGIHWWFTQRHIEIAESMDDLRDQYTRFSTMAAQRSQFEKQLLQVEKYEASNPAFLTEIDYDSAAAGLTQRLKQMVAAHAKDAQSCQIVMNQYSPRNNGDEELYERAGIRVRLRCGLDEFIPVLYDLENDSPMLFIDEIQINKQGGYRGPSNKQTNNVLDIQFTMFGYMRHNMPTSTEDAV